MNRVLLVCCLLIAGCSAAPAASPTPETDADTTPWLNEMVNLQPDGTRSLESALRLFAMAFGPIPGVDAQRGAVGTIDSASPAVRVLRQHLDELPSEQRAAVEGYLAPSEDSRTLDIPPAGTDASAPPAGAVALTGAFVAANPYFELENEVVQEGLRARSRAAEFFGDIPSVRIRTTTREGEPFVSFFIPTFGPGGFEWCDVIVNRATANADRFATRRAITLDVVHCFQSWVMGSEAGFARQVPAWAWEGPAEYISLTLWPSQPADEQAWERYTKLPDIPLFERAYDAIGYYAQLFEAGLNVGDAFRAVLTDADNPGRFAAAGTDSDQFLDAWASGLAGLEWGEDWGFAGPGFTTTPASTPRQPFTVTNGSEETFSQAAYSNHLYEMHSSADLVRLEFEGRPRLSDGVIDTTLLGSALFCTRAGGCPPCPDGTPLDAPQLGADSILAVSGGIDGTIGTVSGEKFEDNCRPTPRPSAPAPEPCGSDCATSAGDPHIVTVDGSEYDFQAAGEYVLLRSADGAFEVQARQEPWPDHSNISFNTAIALRLGTSRLMMVEDVEQETVAITVDGSPIVTSEPVRIGDAAVIVEADGFMATFDDGTVVYGIGGVGDGINVLISASQALFESGGGVMARVPDGGMGVPALPDGTVLPPTDDPDAYHDALYDTFAEAWRVTRETSLFDYVPGASVDTFVVPGFPTSVVTLDDLTPEQRDAGEVACGLVEDDVLREMCIFDAGITNNLGFGELYLTTETVAETGSITGSEVVEVTRPPR